MQECGISVDHSTVNCWVLKYGPQLPEAFHRHKRLVSLSWRLDETYNRVPGQWRYPPCSTEAWPHHCLSTHLPLRPANSPALPPQGASAPWCPRNDHHRPERDQFSRHPGYNKAHGTAIIIHQVKYLNNIVEQDHRSMKQVTRLLSEFMSVEASPRYSGWHRVQAHAQERPNGGEKGDRRIHSGRTVLLPSSLIRSPVRLSLSPLKICDSSDIRSTEKRYDTRRYVSFLRIAR
jgi:hypothetical protein